MNTVDVMKAGWRSLLPDKQSGNVILILLRCYSDHNLGDGERPWLQRGGMEGRGKQAEAQRPGPSVVAVLLPIFIMSHSSVATNTLLKRTKGKHEHAHKLKLQFILFLDKRMQHHKA